MITAYHGTSPVPPSGSSPAASNPVPVEVQLANGSFALLLAFDTMNNPSASHHGLDYIKWSLDEGLTWGQPTELSFPPRTNIGALLGPGKGPLTTLLLSPFMILCNG